MLQSRAPLAVIHHVICLAVIVSFSFFNRFIFSFSIVSHKRKGDIAEIRTTNLQVKRRVLTHGALLVSGCFSLIFRCDLNNKQSEYFINITRIPDYLNTRHI